VEVESGLRSAVFLCAHLSFYNRVCD
jgi:hypothetical protein